MDHLKFVFRPGAVIIEGQISGLHSGIFIPLRGHCPMLHCGGKQSFPAMHIPIREEDRISRK